jgi:branched-chain amino acid transport system ATP-binding protein
MALLEVKDLEAQYGWTKVLHGISFDVEEGGITTILGANGAGKTTTLRAVCGMVKTRGEVRFDGARSPAGRRKTWCAAASRTCRRAAAPS